MKSHFIITSSAFAPTHGELDGAHDDFINPGIYALELANFLGSELSQRGYPTRFRCQEDWGHWIELEHEGKYTLAVCCSNAGENASGQAEHRIFLVPDMPVVRRLFRKIDVRSDLERLAATLKKLLEDNPQIESIRIEDAYQ